MIARFLWLQHFILGNASALNDTKRPTRDQGAAVFTRVLPSNPSTFPALWFVTGRGQVLVLDILIRMEGFVSNLGSFNEKRFPFLNFLSPWIGDQPNRSGSDSTSTLLLSLLRWFSWYHLFLVLLNRYSYVLISTLLKTCTVASFDLALSQHLGMPQIRTN